MTIFYNFQKAKSTRILQTHKIIKILMIQEQVQQLKFEQVYIKKIRHRAQRSQKIRDWLALLKAYEQNQMQAEKNQTIRSMHFKFLLNEAFWLQEAQKRINQQVLTQEDLDLLFLGIDDGYYDILATTLETIFIRQLNNRNSNFRKNYLISKIQRLIQIFGRGKNFYKKLRQYYKDNNSLDNKQNSNQKRIRELYIRQLKQGYDDHDILYDQYLLWQKDKKQQLKSEQLYEEAKQAWQSWPLYQQNHQTLHHPETMSEDVRTYMKQLQKVSPEWKKLRLLRIICLSRHDLCNEYFQLLQYMHHHDEELVMKSYRSLLDIIPEIEKCYLRFLVRRINKHVQAPQDQQYNKTWAAKVQEFREEISELINKPRLTPKTQQSIKQSYYLYWIDVQTSLIKDKQSVCQLFEALLQIKNSVELYTKYSQCMVRLGFYADAKNILKRSCAAFKYDYQAEKQFENFINVYGSIADCMAFTKLKMTQREQKEQMRDLLNKNQINKSNDKNHNKSIKNEQQNNQIQSKPQQNQKQFINTRNKLNNQYQNKEQNREGGSIYHNNHQMEEQKSKVNPKNIDQQSLSPQKKQEKEIQPKKKMHIDSGNTLFIRGFPTTYRQEQITQLIKNKQKIKQIRLVQKMGQFKNYCYVEMSTAEDASHQVQLNKSNKEISFAISRPPSAYSQEKTLFLCGLPHSTTIQKIRQLFRQQIDQIVDIRLKLDNNKNIVYIDFSSQQTKLQVLQKYKNSSLAIDSKKIIIRQSQSRGHSYQKKQHRVIILKQLSYKASQKDIVQFFKDYSIQDVYIPQDSQGKSKGFAYVKFKKQEEYYNVLDMKKGVIKNRNFQIHKSERDIQRPKRQENRGSKDKKKVEKIQDEGNEYFSKFFK